MIAGYVLGTAMALILMHYSTKLPYAFARNFCVCLSIGIFLTLGQNLWQAHSDKTRWYHLKDMLPESVWQFMSSSVKKDSWLPKRIYRLLEIFLSDDFDLFDSQDWRKLQQKFQTLIVDYIMRVLGFSSGSMKSSASTGKGDF